MFSFDTLIGNATINTICEYLLLVVVLLNYKSLQVEKEKLRNGYLFLWLLLVFVSVFYSPTDGDSFTGSIKFVDYKLGEEIELLHFEPIYFALMDITSSYTLWRFIIWGTAAAIIVITLKKLKCSPQCALFIWASLGIQAFYYQRVALGISMLFAGVVIILSVIDEKKTRHKLLKIIIALSLIAFSMAFHSTLLIYVVLSAIVILIQKKRWLIVGIFVLLPFFISDIISNFEVLLDTTDAFQGVSHTYLNASTSTRLQDTNSVVFDLFKWIPYAIMMLVCVIDLFRHPSEYSSYETYFLLLSALLYLLYFVMQGKVAFSAAGKMKMQSILSMSMFLCLYFTNHRDKKVGKYYALCVFFVYIIIFVYNEFF